MTMELILLLTVFSLILLGVFFGDLGPIQTFKKSSPRLAARIEKNVTPGRRFWKNSHDNEFMWQSRGN